ncbi:MULTISPECIES: ESX secretion-associated protein EspG [Actinosynnema]|uniref:ESX secretion-associated protein EspG n=1 Tax=Actinosynnema TaxID=40566 RepID=UPI0020A59016|nr:ESX secretion-associated protein EspG [Actinosynnema pretiosum]MCP2095899.1 EspG family protein [Actinosynnema pretiosum]
MGGAFRAGPRPLTGHTVLWDPVRLTAAEFAGCWEQLDLGEPPGALGLSDVDPVWPAEVLVGLRRRGIALRGARLERQLRALARRDYAVDVDGCRAPRPVRVRASVVGSIGVLAERCGDEVVLVSVPHYAVPAELVARLPESASVEVTRDGVRVGASRCGPRGEVAELIERTRPG